MSEEVWHEVRHGKLIEYRGFEANWGSRSLTVAVLMGKGAMRWHLTERDEGTIGIGFAR